MEIISESLDERQMMFYMKDPDLQKIIDEHNWGGRVLQTEHDYVSVINANINGFKTDGVVDQEITHHVNIARNGRITNTVTVTRKHNGGHTGREWWDAVNANYMRVYVPKGSRLLSVEGHTYEINEPRLDYDELGFLRDPDVVAEERDMQVLEDSSTRVYNQFDKTVFANWVYVSPQETVRVTYKYELPWRITYGSDDEGLFGAYGVFYQKQAGSTDANIVSTITFPEGAQKVWSYPEKQGTILDEMVYDGPFKRDRYHGAVYRLK